VIGFCCQPVDQEIKIAVLDLQFNDATRDRIQIAVHLAFLRKPDLGWSLEPQRTGVVLVLLVAALGVFAALLQLFLALCGALLLFLVLLDVVGALGGVGCTLLLRGLELGVVVRLFLAIRLCAGGTLWGARLALRFVQALLLLLALEIGAVLLLGGLALRAFGVVLGIADGAFLIAAGGTVGALGLIQREFTFADGVEFRAACFLGFVDAARDEEFVIASALGLGVPVFGPRFGTADAVVFGTKIWRRAGHRSNWRGNRLGLAPCGRGIQRCQQCSDRQHQAGNMARTSATASGKRERRHNAHFITAPVRACAPNTARPRISAQERGWRCGKMRGFPSHSLEAMTDSVLQKIVSRIAVELAVKPHQVAAAVQLLDEGATVPFIARYRKEVTDNLDDTQLRNLEERLLYLRELEDRRAAILASIEEQGKLTDPLRTAIEAAETKQVLEDLYLPYKPKRRTRAQIARECGLEPLAQALLADPTLDPQVEAAKFVNGNPTADGGVPDAKAALDGARDILSEQFGETAELLGKVREHLWNQGLVSSTVVEGKETAEEEKFRDYYAYSEPIRNVPSHRALALFRGRNAGVLFVKLGLGEEQDALSPHPCETMIARHVGIENKGRAADKWLSDVCRWCWRVKVQPHIETELLTQLRESAEAEAIKIFGRNLHDLLLAAPAGPKAVMGVDPGIRTGCKIAVVDHTGKLLETATIYPHEPRRDWNGSLATMARLAKQHNVALVSIGNGTASRETDKLVQDLMRNMPELKLTKIVVSEAGASVYSASELAAKEFPELDVSLRGAVSIARRLQDPLAELVKIDPKSIGVGQYQHDVNQRELARALDAIVEDCVNAVGVDVNTASAPLLARVSGLNSILAKNIVEYRDANGAFANRDALKKVPRLGDKTFEQAAGFLRINDGDNPLDRSSVHPEAYPVVKRILDSIKKGIGEVLGNREALRGLTAREFTDEKFGLPTVVDILSELEKPGRDPRPEFKTATFQDGVEDIKHLQPGMVLEGVVTNVAAFGAFIDIGVHQDGLVHVSALSTKFVRDPHEVVKPGQIVKVKVMEVDVKRNRIGLTMRLSDEPGQAAARAGGGDRPNGGGNRQGGQQRREAAPAGGAMAAAFAKLKR